MDTMEKRLLSLTGDVIKLRQDMLEVMATNTALIEVLCPLAQKVTGQDAGQLRNEILLLSQKHLHNLLKGYEDASPTVAAILDTRSLDDLEGAVR